MYKYGKASRARLDQADPRLQEVFEVAIQFMDISILEGHRPKEVQDKYFAEGKSKVQFPDSKHNKYPSMAVDAAPYPIDWDNHKRFGYMAGLIIGIGAAKGYKIRWGGDWSMDGDTEDQTFHDLPHFEIIES